MRSQAGNMLPASFTFRTEAGATAILAGEPVKIGGTGTNYVVPIADAEPTTTVLMMGIAASSSTHTASVGGTVEVILATPEIVWEAKAKTASTVDTDAKILALLNDVVPFDLTTGSFTVDVAAAAATNGLRILGGDPSRGVVYFNILTQGSQISKT